MKKGLWLVVIAVLLALLLVQGVAYAQGTGVTGVFHNMTMSHEGGSPHHADMADMVHREGAAHEGMHASGDCPGMSH